MIELLEQLLKEDEFDDAFEPVSEEEADARLFQAVSKITKEFRIEEEANVFAALNSILEQEEEYIINVFVDQLWSSENYRQIKSSDIIGSRYWEDMLNQFDDEVMAEGSSYQPDLFPFYKLSFGDQAILLMYVLKEYIKKKW